MNNMTTSTRWLIRKDLEYLKKAVNRKDYGYANYKATTLYGAVTALMNQDIINSYTYFMLTGIISSIDAQGKIKMSLVKKFTDLV